MADHAGDVAQVELGTIITSPAARRIVYGVYVVLLLVLGAVTVGFAAIGQGLPTWGVAASAVLGYIGIPVGSLAIVNTPKGS